jgi:hypothetical protein
VGIGGGSRWFIGLSRVGSLCGVDASCVYGLSRLMRIVGNHGVLGRLVVLRLISPRVWLFLLHW